jgi:hypothetical protein
MDSTSLGLGLDILVPVLIRIIALPLQRRQNGCLMRTVVMVNFAMVKHRRKNGAYLQGCCPRKIPRDHRRRLVRAHCLDRRELFVNFSLGCIAQGFHF